jgi:hypothetical protein
VQLRHQTELTSEEYIRQNAWTNASLEPCGLPPERVATYRRHGSYGRCKPAGLRVARFYSCVEHATISLLPDFAAARVSSTLVDIEQSVVAVQGERENGANLEQAARMVAPTGIEPQGAVRRERCRRRWVTAALAVLIGLLPEVLAGCEPSLTSVRGALGCTGVDSVLVRVREIAAAHLAQMPAPVGFGPLPKTAPRRNHRRQHKRGADP